MSFKQFGGKNKFNQSKEITTNSIISEFSYSKNATVQDIINANTINANEIIVSKDVSGNITRDTFYRMNVVNSRHALGGSGTKQLELDWYEEDEGNIPANSYAVRIGGNGGMSNLVIAAQDNPIITFHPNPAFGGIDIHRIVDMCNNKIVNLDDPTAAQDAANKKYVDDEIAGVSVGTLTGNLDMSNNKIVNLANPTDTQDAATKNYVDVRDALKLDLSGGTLTGNLDMCNNKIVNLADPTAAQDAATRNYVNNEDALKLNLTGGTLTGNLNVNGDTNVGGRIVLNKDTFRFIRVIDPSSNEETLGFNYRVDAGENVPVSCLPSYYWRIRVDEDTTTFGFTSVSGPLLFMGRTQGIQIYKPITMNDSQIEFSPVLGDKINLFNGGTNEFKIGVNSNETYITTGEKFHVYRGNSGDNQIQIATDNLDNVIIPNGNLDMSGNKIENVANGTATGDVVNFGQFFDNRVHTQFIDLSNNISSTTFVVHTQSLWDISINTNNNPMSEPKYLLSANIVSRRDISANGQFEIYGGITYRINNGAPIDGPYSTIFASSAIPSSTPSALFPNVIKGSIHLQDIITFLNNTQTHNLKVKLKFGTGGVAINHDVIYTLTPLMD